jgi:TPR repeat protein
MGLLPEMMHAVRDGIRLTKDDAAASMQGEGFVWFADRLLKESDGSGPKPDQAMLFLLQAAELGVTSAFVRIGQMYETGTGTQPDLKLALAAYLRAITDDHPYGYSGVLRVLSGLVRQQPSVTTPSVRLA